MKPSPTPSVQPRRPHRLAAWLLAAAFAGGAWAQDPRYDAAQIDYEIGHVERAFEAFSALADEGHCDAARMAREMVRQARTLYLMELKVDPARLQRWHRLPHCPTLTSRR